MPEVEKLFDMIQSDPPGSVEELQGMLADTGYDGAPEGVAGMEGAMDEEMAEEDMEEEGEERSLDDLLSGMEGEMDEEGAEEDAEEDAEEGIGPAPAGMEGGGVKGVSISVMRGNAAKNALKKEKGRKS